jgi:hypothetical protein
LRSLLGSLLAAEVLSPSNCLWLVSPWVGDPPILDNRAGTFSAVEPDWPREVIRLHATLESILRRGGRLVAATKPAASQPYNRGFTAAVRRWRELGLAAVLRESEELHEKGMLGDGFFLFGSMNFTDTGVERAEELVSLRTDNETLAYHRRALADRWGGRDAAEGEVT